MLAMNPQLLAQMETDHLLSSLAAEGPLTPAEIELSRRLEEYESALEQSEFRAQLIQEIIALCDRPGNKKDLVTAIKYALENSYVEL